MKLAQRMLLSRDKNGTYLSYIAGIRNVVANLVNFANAEDSKIIRKIASELSESSERTSKGAKDKYFYDKDGKRYSSPFIVTTGNERYRYLPLQGPPLSAGALDNVPTKYPTLNRYMSTEDVDLSDEDLQKLISNSRVIKDPVRWHGITEKVNKLFNDEIIKYNSLVKPEHRLSDTAGRSDDDFLFVLRPLILSTLIQMNIHEDDKPFVVSDFMTRFLVPQVRIDSEKLEDDSRPAKVCKLVSLLKPSPRGGFASAYLKLAIRSAAIDYLRKKSRQSGRESFYEGSEIGREGTTKEEAFSSELRRREQEELRRSTSETQFMITEDTKERVSEINSRLNPLNLEFPILPEEKKYPTASSGIKKVINHISSQNNETSPVTLSLILEALNEEISDLEKEISSTEYGRSRDNLENKQRRLQEKLESLESLSFVTGKDSISSLYDRLAVVQENLNYARGYESSLTLNIASLEKAISESHTRLQMLRFQYERTIETEDRVELQKEAAKLSNNIATYNSSLNEKNNSLEDIRDAIKDLEGKVKDIRRAIPDADFILSNLSTTVTDLGQTGLYLSRTSPWGTGEIEDALEVRLGELGITGVEYVDYEDNMLYKAERKYPDPLDLYYAKKRKEDSQLEDMGVEDYRAKVEKKKYEEILKKEDLSPEEKSWKRTYELRVNPKKEGLEDLESPELVNFRKLMDRIHKNINKVRIYPGKINSEKNILGRVILRLLFKLLTFGEHNMSLARTGSRTKSAKEMETRLDEVAAELAGHLESKEGESEDSKLDRAYKIILESPEIFFHSLGADIGPIDIQRFIALSMKKNKDLYDLLTPTEQTIADKGHLFFDAGKREEKALLAKDVEATLRKISNEKFKKLLEIIYAICILSFAPAHKLHGVSKEEYDKTKDQYEDGEEAYVGYWEDLKEKLFSPYKPEDKRKKNIVDRLSETYGASNLFDFLAVQEKDDLRPTLFIPEIKQELEDTWINTLKQVQESMVVSVSADAAISDLRERIKVTRAEIDRRIRNELSYTYLLGMHKSEDEDIVRSIRKEEETPFNFSDDLMISYEERVWQEQAFYNLLIFSAGVLDESTSEKLKEEINFIKNVRPVAEHRGKLIFGKEDYARIIKGVKLIRKLLTPPFYIEKLKKKYAELVELESNTKDDKYYRSLERILQIPKSLGMTNEKIEEKKEAELVRLEKIISEQSFDEGEEENSIFYSFYEKLCKCIEHERGKVEELLNEETELETELASSVAEITGKVSLQKNRELEKSYLEYKDKVSLRTSDLVNGLEDRLGKFKYFSSLEEVSYIDSITSAIQRARETVNPSEASLKASKKSLGCNPEQLLIFMNLLLNLENPPPIVYGQSGKKNNIDTLKSNYPEEWSYAEEMYNNYISYIESSELSKELSRKIMLVEEVPPSGDQTVTLAIPPFFLSGFPNLDLDGTDPSKTLKKSDLTDEDLMLINDLYKHMVLLNNPLEMRKSFQRDTGLFPPILEKDINEIVDKGNYLLGSVKKLVNYGLSEEKGSEETAVSRDDRYALALSGETKANRKKKVNLESQIKNVFNSLIAERIYRQDLPDFIDLMRKSKDITPPRIKEDEEEGEDSIKVDDAEVKEKLDAFFANLAQSTVTEDQKNASEENEENFQIMLKMEREQGEDVTVNLPAPAAVDTINPINVLLAEATVEIKAEDFEEAEETTEPESYDPFATFEEDEDEDEDFFAGVELDEDLYNF